MAAVSVPRERITAAALCLLFTACNRDALPGSNDAAIDSALPDADATCATIAAEVQQWITNHSACNSDADCTTSGTPCGLMGECGVYINQSGVGGLRSLGQQWTDAQCAHGPCPNCPAIPPAACVRGRCAAIALSVQLDGASVFQDCMPNVSPDPLQLKAQLTVNNTSAVADGPLSASRGVIVDAGGKVIASFDITLINPGSIPPMSQTSYPVNKVTGTLVPEGGCNTVQCGSTVVVGIDYYVTGQSGRALSMPVQVQCAF